MEGHLMTKSLAFRLLPLAVTVVLRGTVVSAQDASGGKDHPLFTRMPNYFISEYQQNEFASEDFRDATGESVTVEGKKTEITYTIKPGVNPPSTLQVLRNYTNAIKKVGGTAFEYTQHSGSVSLKRDGAEVWANIYVGGEYYELTIVEKGALRQEVTASGLLEALNTDGHVALYILFDTGKATIKPESGPIITQVVAMMKEAPSLTISVEGHTDSTGTAQANRVLSMDRARAVVAALVQQGVAATRLSAVGHGQDKPVAADTTEEGRAKNRRVELVKK
jgi:outer membrane protein OmpA-like peptidoglycan-associated protein